MAIKKDSVRHALRRVLDVERNHMFGVTTGSPTARRRELVEELDKIIAESGDIRVAERKQMAGETKQ